jgi:tetratricopeptide (TPR) repeat protein
MQFSSTSMAQSQTEWLKCLGLEGTDLDIVIDGCTVVIQSGQDPPEKLATAFDNRGVACKVKRQYDRALQDYESAIRLNPSNADAYNNRGVIYRIKADYDHAIADYDEAIWLTNGDFLAAYYNRALEYADKGEYCLGQLLQQRFRFLQIARLEALSEPPVNRSQQFARLLHLALVAPETREAHCGA